MISDNFSSVPEGKIKWQLLFCVKIFKPFVPHSLVCCGFPRLLSINNVCVVRVLADPVVISHVSGTGRPAQVAVTCFPCAQVILETGLEEWWGSRAMKCLNNEDVNEKDNECLEHQKPC